MKIVQILLFSYLFLFIACEDDESIATVTVSESSGSFSNEQGNFNPTDRAELENKLYERWKKWHIPHGQSWTASFKTNGEYYKGKGCACVEDQATDDLPYCGDVVTEILEDKFYKYSGTGDGAIFTGHALAMLSYKLAATQDPTVYDDFLTVLDAVEKLFKVTGKKGLLARAFIPPNTPIALDGESIITNTSGAYKDYKWSGDISRDQYSGIMFGLWTAWDLVKNDDVRKRISSLVKDVAEVLIDNNHTIPKEEGQGSLSFKAGVFESGQAIYLISYIQMAWLMTGETKFKDYFNDITSDSGVFDVPAINIAKKWGTDDPSLTSLCHYRGKTGDNDTYYRFNIIAPAIFMINMMASQEEHKTIWQDVLNVFWSGHNGVLVNWDGLQDDKNSFFDILYTIGKNGGYYDFWKTSDHDKVNNEAVNDALKQLALFPDSYRKKTVVINDIEEKKGCAGTANTALNIDLRGSYDFIWQKSPYQISQSCYQPWVEYSGVDYLLAYWMVRYSGYFKSPTIKVTSTTVEKMKAKSVFTFQLELSDWIPHTQWEISNDLTVALYSEDKLLWSKPIFFDRVIKWTSENIILSFDSSEVLNPGKYKLRIQKSLYNIPGDSFPDEKSVFIDVWSPEFQVVK